MAVLSVQYNEQGLRGLLLAGKLYLMQFMIEHTLVAQPATCVRFPAAPCLFFLPYSQPGILEIISELGHETIFRDITLAVVFRW